MKTKQRTNSDWRSIENEKEKYAAYLCSREWAVLKETVKERSGGVCERCKVLPGDAVHHLNYERKYNEAIDDLQHNCKACHEFTHAKSDFDPSANAAILRWLLSVKSAGKKPIPVEFLFNIAFANETIEFCLKMRAMYRTSLWGIDLDPVTWTDFENFFDAVCGFSFISNARLEQRIKASDDPCLYAAACQVVGLECRATKDELQISEDDE